MLQHSACGFGAIALRAMLADKAFAAGIPLAANQPLFVPKAKRVIFLFMSGGPSQLDLFTPKPRLAESSSANFDNRDRTIPTFG